MIGTNFRTVSDIHLQRFQKVFTTHNGREVSGYIQRYQGDHVLIRIPGNIEGKEIISRKPDEIRLLDSRKSQKVRNLNSIDCRNMSEEDNQCKRRTVSASIEMPQPGPRIRRTSEEPTMTELMAAMVLSSLSSSPVFHNPDNLKASSLQSFGSSEMGSWSQDSRHTSPSRQPPSVGTPQSSTRMRASPYIEPRERVYKEQEQPPRSFTPEDVLDVESGTILLQRSTPTPTKTNLEDKSKDMEISDEPQDLRVPKVHVEHIVSPRPASHSSQASSSYSDPGRLEVVMEKEERGPKIEQGVPIPMAMPLALGPQISLPYYFAPGLLQQPFPASLPAEFRFQLAGTPPRLPEVGSSAPGHIDSKIHRHLHRAVPYKISEDTSVPSPAGGSSPSTLSFGSAPSSYYNFPNTPVPVASLSFSPSHHGKHSRSPLASKTSYSSPAPNTHSNPITVPSNPPRYSILRDSPYPNAMQGQPLNAPNPKAFSWHSGASANFVSKPVVQQRQQMHQAVSPKINFPMSPKSVAMGRKVRGDGKKCRKVYGMENRDLWCTACKWKKACQRFPD